MFSNCMVYSPLFQSALSCRSCLLTARYFTAAVTSDYEPSKQAQHHEIEWFFATTFMRISTFPYRVTRFAYAAPLRHLENNFQLDRRAERKTCVNQAARVLLFSEDVLQQLRSRVRDFRLIADISRSCDHHPEPDDPCYSV